MTKGEVLRCVALVLISLDVEDAIAVYNEVCYRKDNVDGLIFETKDIDGMLGSISVREAFKLADRGDFRISDKYVYQLGEGKKACLYSFNDTEDVNFKRIFDVIELAESIVEIGCIVDFRGTKEYEQRFKDWLLNTFVTE